MAGRRVRYQSEIIEVNNGTGEVEKYTKQTTSRIPQEPPFIKVYLDYIMFLNDLSRKHSAVLMCLILHMSYADAEAGQTIFVNAAMKKRIADKLDTTIGCLNNSLTALVRCGVLFRIARGTYQVNPFIFGRGDWRDIELLRFEISFDAIGRTAKSEIQQKKMQI